MDFRFTVRVSLLATILVAISLVFAGQCMELNYVEALENARNSLRSVVSAQMAFYAQNGSYGSSAELLDGKFLDDRFTGDPANIGNGCWVKINQYGQSFLAISIQTGTIFVAGESGEIFTIKLGDEIQHGRKDEIRGMLSEIEQGQIEAAHIEEARNSIRHVVAGEFAYYATNGRYGTSVELLKDNFVSDRFVGDPADLGNGIGIKTNLDSGEQSFLIVCHTAGTIFVASETGEIFTIKVGEEIQHERSEEILLMLAEIDELQSAISVAEYARNNLRSVVSAEFAHYAVNGRYGSSVELVGDDIQVPYLDSKFAGDPADLGQGCWIKIQPSSSGQNFLAISSVKETLFVADETGRIFEYAEGEDIRHHQSEEILLMLAEIEAAKDSAGDR